ncbi:HNH endonuclease [Corynebacterium sanguinis]|uniref:GmrSD restriction endonuclease domain-containing protein n=1 Tax=Corynebacterium sanguinis TaxID=2594913 RepID=UPI0011A57349|nr:DUF1524 domain-containing protein [Corynebacterium sanguinis]TVS26088.1 HNH endonuclease [Corynebacterium sanguinis]
MDDPLSNAWREELEPDAEAIHRTWVKRIANLTITGYNSQYSNSSFSGRRGRRVLPEMLSLAAGELRGPGGRADIPAA